MFGIAVVLTLGGGVVVVGACGGDESEPAVDAGVPMCRCECLCACGCTTYGPGPIDSMTETIEREDSCEYSLNDNKQCNDCCNCFQTCLAPGLCDAAGYKDTIASECAVER